MLTFFTACNDSKEYKHKEIVCLHSWSDYGEEGEPFRKMMESKIHEYGIKANVHHIYLNAEERVFEQFDIEVWPSIRDSIYALHPDLLLVNDDPALTYLLTHEFDNKLLNAIPVVFAGIDCLMTDSVAKHPNYSGFQDQLDIAKNMDFIIGVKDDPTIIIELGETEHDLLLRSNIAKQAENITSPVMVYSSASHRIDTMNVESKGNPARSNWLAKNAKNLQLLQVKHDYSSHALINRSTSPQFTAIREKFNNPAKRIFLGGYFTGMEIQIDDQIRRTKEIFNGKNPSHIPIEKHQNQYYIDYEALTMLKQHNPCNLALQNIEEDITGSSKIKVVNAPLSVTQPALWNAIILGCVLLVCIAIAVCTVIARKWIRRKRQFLTLQIDNETDMRRQILEDSKSYVWTSKDGIMYFDSDFSKKYNIPHKIKIEDFNKYIHSSSIKEWNKLANTEPRDNMGRQKIRICVSFDNKMSWHWFDLIFDIRPDSQTAWHMEGLCVNVDEVVALDTELKEVSERLKELENKQKKIHDLNSNFQEPLEEVMLHSYAIRDAYSTLSPQELSQHQSALTKSIKELNKLVELLSGTVTAILLVVMIAMSSCQKKEQIRVLVIHQYDADLASYTDFDNAIATTLAERGYEPDIKNFYMNLEDQQDTEQSTKLRMMRDSLFQAHWKADIILGEGDRLLKMWHDNSADLSKETYQRTPIVFGGILFPNWDNLSIYNNVSIFTDRLDVAANAKMAHELLGKNIVEIELDTAYTEDSLIMNIINTQCSRPPFVNNADLHIGAPNTIDNNPVYLDSIVLYVLSAEDPYRNVSRNVPADSSAVPVVDGMNFTRNIYKTANRYTSLIVKKDLWSECFAKKNNDPNITARKEWFKAGNYLGGYFTDYATVGHDITALALDQHEGKAKMNLSRTHTPQKHLDYEKMKMLGLNYSDYSDDYVITNAPMYKSQPVLFYSLVIAIILVSAILGWILYIFGKYLLSMPFSTLEQELDTEHKMNSIAIIANDSVTIETEEDLRKITKGIDPAQEDIKVAIIESLQKKGHHNYVRRIHAHIEGRGGMEWWQLRYAINRTENEFSINGSQSNIDAEMRNKEEIKELQKRFDEVKKAELFFETLAYEIHTPLNGIMGCCDLLTSQITDISDEEKNDLAHSISVNNMLLKKIVNDLVQYSQIATHHRNYSWETIDVGQLTRSLFEDKGQYITGKNLRFDYIEDRPCSVKADASALREVLYQLLNNAYKFTSKGSVALGWQYNLNDDTVEIFVEDSGEGISEENKAALFTQYWKANNYSYGTGIGLHIAKTYAEAMGGTIGCESEEGLGSRFFIKLPCAIAKQEA